MSSATTKSAQTPQLRPPFKLVAHVSSRIAAAVNGTIDGAHSILGKSANAFLSKYGFADTKSIKSLYYRDINGFKLTIYLQLVHCVCY